MGDVMATARENFNGFLTFMGRSFKFMRRISKNISIRRKFSVFFKSSRQNSGSVPLDDFNLGVINGKDQGLIDGEGYFPGELHDHFGRFVDSSSPKGSSSNLSLEQVSIEEDLNGATVNPVWGGF